MNMILVRGIPGSGKSTFAKALTGYFHLETDMFWGENYDFDITRIKEAHDWCIDCTDSWLSRNVNNITKYYGGVVISNTFTTKEEMIPYFDIAKKYGITPLVVCCQSNFQTVHDVPSSIIEKMRDRFDNDISGLYERIK